MIKISEKEKTKTKTTKGSKSLQQAYWGVIYGLIVAAGFLFGEGLLLGLSTSIIYYIIMLIISISLIIAGFFLVKMMQFPILGFSILVPAIATLFIYLQGIMGITILGWFGVPQLTAFVILLIGLGLMFGSFFPMKFWKLSTRHTFVLLSYTGFILIILSFPVVLPYTLGGVILT